MAMVGFLELYSVALAQCLLDKTEAVELQTVHIDRIARLPGLKLNVDTGAYRLDQTGISEDPPCAVVVDL